MEEKKRKNGRKSMGNDRIDDRKKAKIDTFFWEKGSKKVITNEFSTKKEHLLSFLGGGHTELHVVSDDHLGGCVEVNDGDG